MSFIRPSVINSNTARPMVTKFSVIINWTVFYFVLFLTHYFLNFPNFLNFFYDWFNLQFKLQSNAKKLNPNFVSVMLANRIYVVLLEPYQNFFFFFAESLLRYLK